VEFGRVRYGVTGIIPAQSSNVLAIERYRAEITQIVGAEPPRQGLLVADVEPGLPASRLGIQSLNVITGMDGKKINDITDFLTLLGNKRPGETVTLDVWAAGKVKSLKLTLAEDVPAQRE
jgi:S1-C subfamily serine protease